MNTFFSRVTKIFQKKTVLALTAVLSIASGFFVANLVSAVAPDVVVSPVMVKGGSVGTTYDFNITNNLTAPIYDITITAPAGFTVTDKLVCPEGWANHRSTASLVECLGNGDPASELFIPVGGQGVVSFSATAPSNDSVTPWNVEFVDSAYAHHSYIPITTVDATAPVTAISQTDTEWHKGSVSITLTPSDVGGSNVASTHYKINDGAWNTYTAPFEVSTQGINSVSYYSIDGVENTETTKKVESIKIDNVAPETMLTIGEKKSGTDPVYVKSNTKISLSATDDGSQEIVTSYTLDKGVSVVYSDPFTLSGSGIHTISYNSVDAVSNVEDVRTVSVFVDDKAPILGSIVISPISGSFISGLSDISATVSDADGSGVAKCEYTLDGGANWTLIAGGACAVTGVNTKNASIINIRATDNLGNDVIGTPVLVTPDFAKPVTTDSGTDENWYKVNVAVTLTTDADASGVASTHYQINGGAWNLYTAPFEVSSEGVNTISYYSVDKVGNAETAHQTAFTVKIDKTAPTITDNNVSGWKNIGTTVTLSPADPLSGIAGVQYCEGACDVSKGTILVSPYTISFTDDGVKTIRYQTADVAGNLSAIGTFTVQTDTSKPSSASVSVTPIHTVSSINYVRGTVTLDASALDTVSGIAKVVFYHPSVVPGMIGEDASASYSLTWDTHSVPDGSHEVYVVAYDQAGNILESAHFPVTVDNETPTLVTNTLSGGFAMDENKMAFSPNSDHFMDTMSIDTKFSEEVVYSIKIKSAAGVVVESWNGTATDPDPKKWNGTSAADGLYTVEITATDHAGNTFTDTSKTILLDNTAPTVDVGADITTATEQEVIASTHDTDAGIATYSWTGTGLTFSSATTKDTTISVSEDDVYAATLTVTDNVGNHSSDTLTYTKDTAKPTVALSSPIADSVYKTNENILAFTASDTGTSITCSYQIGAGSVVSIPCTGNASLSGLVDGRNTVTVTVTDTAGNHITSDPVSFVYDNNNTLTVGAIGADFTTIIEAVKKSIAGDTIAITPGNYNLVKDDTTVISGQTGWYLPIAKSITLIGVDADGQEITNPANVMTNIYSTQETANGNWSTQNLITVFADNVSIRGLGIMNKIEPNKGIEVLGNNFRAENNTFSPVPKSLFAGADNYKGDDITKYGSGVYFNNNGATATRTGTIVNNIFKNSGVTFDSFGSNWTMNVIGNTFDGNRLWVSGGVNYYYSSVGATTWANQPNFTGSDIKINGNKFVNMVDGQVVVKIKDGMTGYFDATKNWWGTTDGSVITGRILGNVSFRPWYLTDALTGLDSVAPAVTLSSTVTSPTNVSPIFVSVAFSESVTGFTIDDISVTNGTISDFTDSGFKVTPIKNGTVTVSIAKEKVQDLSGNYNTASNELSFTYDNVAPTTVLSEKPTVLTNITTANITVSGAEVVAYKYKLDSDVDYGTESAVANHLTLSALTDGSHTLSVIGRDTAGNWQEAATTYSWTVDTQAPTATLTDTPASLTHLKTTDITVAGTDVVAYKYKLDSGSYGTEKLVATHLTLSALTDGSHTLSVIGRDEAGNWQKDADATTYSWTIETVKPTVISKTPSVNAVGIDAHSDITVTFSEAVNIAPENVTVKKGNATVATAVTFDPETKIATIRGTLESNSTYDVTLLPTITDLAGNTLAQTSWSFTTAVSYSIPLTKGWNLISLPVVPSNTSIASVLGTTKNNIETVWSYDAGSGHWSVYHGDNIGTSDLVSMTAGDGYWVNYTADNATNLVGSGNLVQEGNSVPPSRKLKEGWNLIGYYQRPNTDSVSAENALYNNLNNVWTLLFGYDNTNKHITTLNGGSLLHPGEAFWVWLNGDRSYTMGNDGIVD